MTNTSVPFVEYRGFLEAALEFGIDIESGICELIDNAIDAKASTIRLILDKRSGVQHSASGVVHDVIRIFVVDDGQGIPATIEDADTGIEYPGLPFVLSFGGQEADIFASDQQRRIGRFGWGLSATIACLAHKTGQGKVWTKQPGDPAWRSCLFHYNTLLESEMALIETSSSPPLIPPDFTTGTIVMIDCVEPDRTRLKPLQQAILKHAGRTYRHRLVKNKTTITISTLTEGNWDNAQHSTVTLSDPLCLLPGSREVDLFGQAKQYGRITMRFDGTDDEHELSEFGAIEDPLTGRPAEVHIDVSLTSRAAVEHALFANAEPMDAKAQDRRKESFGFGMKGQGFSFVRDGREIVTNRSQGLYTRHNIFNYMHGEIHFPSCLDHLFGIQQNKSRFGAVESLQEALKTAIEGVLVEVRRDVKAQAHGTSERQAMIDLRPAEASIRAAAPHLPTPAYTLEQKNTGDAARAIAKQTLSERILEKQEELIRAVETLALAEDKDERWKDEQTHRITTEMRDLMLQNEQRWQHRAPVRFMPWDDTLPETSAMYEVETRGDEAYIYLRPDHATVNVLHSEDIDQELAVRQSFDLMIGALGYAEHLDCTLEPDNEAMWRTVRENISEAAVRMLAEYGDVFEGGGPQ